MRMEAPGAGEAAAGTTRTRLAQAGVVAALLMATSVAVPGQQANPQQTQPPTFRAGVNAVQVDAFVTDASGRPVRGLTVDDFEVYRDGQPQPITTFATVEIPAVESERGATAPEPDVASNDRPEGRIFMFMLSGMSAEMALRTRHLLHRFMDQYFGENDTAGVMVDRGLVTDGQDFTNNRRLILAAIDKWGGSGTVQPLSPLESGTAGFDLSQPLIDRSIAQDLRSRLEFFNRIPGHRKFVLWFTDSIGFDAYDVVDYHGGVPSLTGEHVHAAVAAATYGNIRVYPISPRGLDGATGDVELERRMDFRAIADVTGGSAHVASNDFDGAFAQLIAETSSYYVLGVEAAPVSQGRYVRFEVRMKRPGLQVKARPGYVDQLEYIRRRTKPEPSRTPVAAALANPVAMAGVPMRVAAAPFKGSGRDAVVALTVDLDASSLTFTEKGDRAVADLQIRHLATGARKDAYPEWRYAGAVEMSSAERRQVGARGLRVVSQLELREGRYQIRVASASGDVAGSVVYDLDVPDFTKGDLTMSGVVLTTAGESQTVTLKGESDGAGRRTTCAPPSCSPGVRTGVAVSRWPLEAKSSVLRTLQQQLVTPPTARRTFAPGETLGVFVEMYDNNKRAGRDPAYQITVEASLRDAAGSVVRQVSGARSSQAALRPAGGGHGFSLRLPLEQVPPGHYVVQIDSRAERDPSHVVTRRIPVRIESNTSAPQGTW